MASVPAVLRATSGIGLVALALGLLAQFLFVDAALGINVPIATVALLAAGWLVRNPAGPTPRLLDVWLAPGAVILSAIVDHAGRFALSALVAGGRPFAALAAALPTLRGRPATGRVAPVLRGLLIAVPLVILFVALFSAADAVFAQITEDLFDWDLDLGSLPGRLVVTVLVAWLSAGLFVFVAGGEDRTREAGSAFVRPARFRLGSAEAVTVLVVLDLLFIGFVVLQGTYLFGGRDTLEASGLTYAEYARRGFFELLTVAFLVGGMILAAERFVGDRPRTYVASAIGLVVLTIVVLASAFLRLRLYQDAYGWTELRFYVLAAIIWLALGAVMAVVTLATDRSRWLLHGMVVLAFGSGLAFNVIGPVRLVTEQNIQRALQPDLVAPGGETGLDIYYLASLGEDALPLLAERRCDLPLSLATSKALDMRIKLLTDDEAGGAWQAWNLSRERAKDLRFEAICLPSAR
jgi:hypothetical protein